LDTLTNNLFFHPAAYPATYKRVHSKFSQSYGSDMTGNHGPVFSGDLLVTIVIMGEKQESCARVKDRGHPALMFRYRNFHVSTLVKSEAILMPIR
jgi:hypothetical protein